MQEGYQEQTNSVSLTIAQAHQYRPSAELGSSFLVVPDTRTAIHHDNRCGDASGRKC